MDLSEALAAFPWDAGDAAVSQQLRAAAAGNPGADHPPGRLPGVVAALARWAGGLLQALDRASTQPSMAADGVPVIEGAPGELGPALLEQVRRGLVPAPEELFALAERVGASEAQLVRTLSSMVESLVEDLARVAGVNRLDVEAYLRS